MFKTLLNILVFPTLPVIAESNISFMFIPSRLSFVYSLDFFINSVIPNSCFWLLIISSVFIVFSSAYTIFKLKHNTNI